MKSHRKNLGQATIEFIFIFAFMSLIGLGIGKTIFDGLRSSVMSLGWVLSQELSTGVCPTRCFYADYQNRVGE